MAAKMREELELSSHNCTPAQFLSYVRSQIRKHGITGVDPMDIDLRYWERGEGCEFDHRYEPGGPCQREIFTSKPYEFQCYIRNLDGSTFNHIMEFQFDDEKKGFGYFYFLNELG